MTCQVELTSVERRDEERSIATFAIRSDTIGPIELKIEVEAASGHEAGAQARHKLHDFAKELAAALDTSAVMA
jgi:hypothetical protein